MAIPEKTLKKLKKKMGKKELAQYLKEHHNYKQGTKKLIEDLFGAEK